MVGQTIIRLSESNSKRKKFGELELIGNIELETIHARLIRTISNHIILLFIEFAHVNNHFARLHSKLFKVTMQHFYGCYDRLIIKLVTWFVFDAYLWFIHFEFQSLSPWIRSLVSFS